MGYDLPLVKRAWVLALLVMVSCAAPPPPRPAPEVAAPETRSVYVTASTLNVRSEASARAGVIGQVRRGANLEVVGEEAGWTQVKLAGGEVGWVSSDYVSRNQPGAVRRRRGCPADSDFAFVRSPMPSFSQDGPHGLVVVEATVNTAGDVTSTKVVSNSTGDTALATKAEREIRTAKFSPPVRDCVPRAFIFTYKRTF